MRATSPTRPGRSLSDAEVEPSADPGTELITGHPAQADLGTEVPGVTTHSISQGTLRRTV